MTFDRTSAFHPNDFIGFEFDNDNDGIREDGDPSVERRDDHHGGSEGRAHRLRFLPGVLRATEPGVVQTIVRWVIEKRGGTWEIIAQQMTAVPPAS